MVGTQKNSLKLKKLGLPKPNTAQILARFGITHKLLEQEIREDYLTITERKLPEPITTVAVKAELKQ